MWTSPRPAPVFVGGAGEEQGDDLKHTPAAARRDCLRHWRPIMMRKCALALAVMGIVSMSDAFVGPSLPRAGRRTVECFAKKKKKAPRQKGFAPANDAATTAPPTDAEATEGEAPEAGGAWGFETRESRDGQQLLDVLTGKPVLFPTKPEDKLARAWPMPTAAQVDALAVPKDADWRVLFGRLDETVSAMDDQLLLDFILTNLASYGTPAVRAISAMKLVAQEKGDVDEARRLKAVRRQLVAASASLLTTFHVSLLERQAELGSFMGRTDVENFCGNDKADRAAAWVVIKAALAAWEDKYTQLALEIEDAASKRGEAGLRSDASAKEKKDLEKARNAVLAMQGMSMAFSSSPFAAELPVECRFIDIVDTLENVEQMQEVSKTFFKENSIDAAEMSDRLRRLEVKLDSARLTRSFRLYALYVRNLADLLGGSPAATWDGVYESDEGRVTPYRITNGFSWSRSPAVPTRNWDAVERNLKAGEEGEKTFNPAFRGFGGSDDSGGDDADVLGLLIRSLNPFATSSEESVADGQIVLLPGVNRDPLDEELPLGKDWLNAIAADDEVDEQEPEYTQEDLDAMVKEYSDESEVRARAKEGVADAPSYD